MVDDEKVNIVSQESGAFKLTADNPAKIPLIVKKIQKIPHYVVSDINRDTIIVQHVDHDHV